MKSVCVCCKQHVYGHHTHIHTNLIHQSHTPTSYTMTTPPRTPPHTALRAVGTPTKHDHPHYYGQLASRIQHAHHGGVGGGGARGGGGGARGYQYTDYEGTGDELVYVLCYCELLLFGDAGCVCNRACCRCWGGMHGCCCSNASHTQPIIRIHNKTHTSYAYTIKHTPFSHRNEHEPITDFAFKAMWSPSPKPSPSPKSNEQVCACVLCLVYAMCVHYVYVLYVCALCVCTPHNLHNAHTTCTHTTCTHTTRTTHHRCMQLSPSHMQCPWWNARILAQHFKNGCPHQVG